MNKERSKWLTPMITSLLFIVASVTNTACGSFPFTEPTSTPTLTPLPTFTPAPTITPSPTLPYTREERDELVGFCTAFSYYLDAEYAFWDAWNYWDPNLEDSNYREEAEVAYAFYEWSLELQYELTGLPRPKATRQLNDLLYDFISKLSDSIYALSEYYYSGNEYDYDTHSSLWDESYKLGTQALDLWEDIAEKYDIDPWECKTISNVEF